MKNLNTFKLLADYEAEKSAGILNTPNVSLITEINSVKCLLENTIPGNFENGYEWVDLGLPSGLKWATCNVGASNPQDYGLYFAWGETTGYTAEQVEAGVRKFDDATYKAGPAASISTKLTLEQDAAHINMGGNWRMPTNDEIIELVDNCTSKLTDNYNGTGVGGWIVMSNNNKCSIFLPFGGYYANSINESKSDGYYWSSTPFNDYVSYYLRLECDHIQLNYDHIREHGTLVRGVCK